MTKNKQQALFRIQHVAHILDVWAETATHLARTSRNVKKKYLESNKAGNYNALVVQLRTAIAELKPKVEQTNG